jgi:hypothetical protein
VHIFYSGSSNSSQCYLPEQALKDVNDGRGPCLMLNHDEIYHKQATTIRRFMEYEKQKKGHENDSQRVFMHFFDSGAFGVYNKKVKKRFVTLEQRIRLPRDEVYAYYHKPAFWKRVDAYAKFVKKHKVACDYYANLDVLYNPELSWEVQQYLEKEHGLKPVPIIHSGTHIKWIVHYLDRGYKFLGLGGFGQQRMTSKDYLAWANRVFKIICPLPKRLPIVRVHGFAMTNYSLLMRFPWWSVDSATWAKAAAYGHVYIPYERGGEFIFSRQPMMLTSSTEMSQRTQKTRPAGEDHFCGHAQLEKDSIVKWLAHLGIPMGEVDTDGDMKKWGVLSHYGARKKANLRFFEALEKSLPKWPWEFVPGRERASFNLQG